jgi:hypothetical protein
MTHRWIAPSLLLFIACGSSQGGQDVKTPAQLLAEEEQAAIDAERKAAERGDHYESRHEPKKREFDRKQADMELKRATRSAATCPEVVAERETAENKQRGVANVTIRFEEAGSVSEASISSPFADTPVGNCVLNAYRSVIVPPFEGGTQIIDWEVSLEDPPPEKKK